jgi:hypothetical protein
LTSSNTRRSAGASTSVAAVGMASGEGALGHGWIREDEVRATLIAIEGELALAMRPPRELAGSRLLRLRLLLLAVESSVLCLEEALRGLRAALRGAATAAGMTRHPEAGCSVLGGPCRVVACPGAACPGVCPGRWGTRP